MSCSPEAPVVCDGFYRDPDAIRSWVLGQSFSNAGKYSFPGWQADKVLGSPEIVEKIQAAMGFPICVDRDKYTFGGVRVITELSGRHSKVHADSVSDWAAMVYLTPQPDLAHGTGFFRHIRTGLHGPPDVFEALHMGFATPHEVLTELVYPDVSRPEAWELTDEVRPYYNRFVAFPGARRFHAPLGGGGTTVVAARMTHMFFFDRAREVRPQLIDA